MAGCSSSAQSPDMRDILVQHCDFGFSQQHGVQKRTARCRGGGRSGPTESEEARKATPALDPCLPAALSRGKRSIDRFRVSVAAIMQVGSPSALIFRSHTSNHQGPGGDFSV
jgi:hypothetical protein